MNCIIHFEIGMCNTAMLLVCVGSYDFVYETLWYFFKYSDFLFPKLVLIFVTKILTCDK